MWEDPQDIHKVADLDRKTLKKWLSMASLGEFNVWHDTNAVIKRLCKELLKKMDKDIENSP